MGKDNRTVDRIQAVWNKLGGEEGIDRLLRGELVVKPATLPIFKVWKTIKLGTVKSVKQYREAIKKAGYKVDDYYASEYLDKLVLSKKEEEIDLVNLSVGELGFKNGATYEAICKRAKELGLELLPAEVGPALRVSYAKDDQPKDEWLRVAVEKPFTASDGYLRVFRVARHGDGVSWLNADWFSPASVWDPGNRFLFRPRK